MTQPGLFDKKPKPRKPNTTASGELACAFGWPWAQHFNGGVCPFCDRLVQKATA